ncbi:formylglycine-generating enzyme family protein [uncultured Thiodictyon sp.]|uniref:formylglycine-generating enzyme family protein n=1 Tax=uncultured Thiodictyon sp. TaxID=1846217 RepID=UPI0025D29444|nr:formylglycine-generating enzyme family protein [uncultured Thiodictyon sp.]
MNRAALGRADLIRWADSLDEDRLCRLAEGLGFKESPITERGGAREVLVERAGISAAVDGTVVQPGAPRHRHYRLTERRPLAPPLPPPPPDPLPPEAPVEPLAAPPSLVPWPRLWPFLRAALGEHAERRRLDLPRAVAAVARARPLRRLPRLKGLRWAPRGQLILDLHQRLYPFWGDFNALKDALPRLRGTAGLDILRMDEGPAGPVQPWDGRAWGPPRPYDPPPADTPILIAGDLGCLDTPGQRAAWVAFGRRLAAGGLAPVALTPCPARWWNPALAGLFYPVVLDRTAAMPPRPSGPRPWPSEPIDPLAAIRHDPGALHLLTLLSACIAISPALLRHLRHRLPVGLADVGSEAAAWLHPAFVPGDFALLPGDPVQIERLRESFGSTGDEGQRELAWALIRAQQETGASQAERIEERVLFAAMQGRTDPAAEAFLDRVAQALVQGRDAEERTRFLGAWVHRRAARMHPGAWTHSPRSEALWLLANPRAETVGAMLPAGFDIHRALATRERSESFQFWRLVQRGEWLEVEDWFKPDSPLRSGSTVVGQFPTRLPVAQVRENRVGAQDQSLALDVGAVLPLDQAGWRLRTDQEELVIEPFDRPAWAHTLGRDKDGLFVGFNDGRGDRRAYWCNPGRGHPEWLGSKLDPRRAYYLALDIQNGFFLDEAQFRTPGAEGLYPAHFRDSIKIDDHGVRGEIPIKGIAVGFRWILPGRFLMGSPADEHERRDNERQHEVILTRGFWLAETACTQALWQALMGENPSQFKGERRPVESVSWDGVQRFIERLNGAVPGLAARLPTEAQWEYACRAGTTTPFSFGEDIDPGQANYDGNYPYRGDQKGLYREQTVDVASLPPNPWGFYEMHGNVWEWCQDWYGEYPADPLTDPRGPATGVSRVLRGGGWFRDGRSLRCATRGHFDPGSRRQNSGFRLVLGPQSRPETP